MTMKNTNIGHKAPSGQRDFCTYTVYDNRTDFPVIVGGTATECAKAMNMTVATFYCTVARARIGRNKRWTILKEYADGKPDADHPDQLED